MNYNEIQKKDIQDIEEMIQEKMQELQSLRFDIAAKKVGTHRKYRMAKRTLAQLLTEKNTRNNSSQ